MPKEAIPAVPSAPVAATPTAPVTVPAARPNTPPARPSTIPKQTPKPKLSAKKALGLEETPRKMVEEETKKMRDRVRSTEPSLELSPAPAAPEKPEVTAPTAPVAALETPVVPATPAKIKIGDKEYTSEELEAKVKKADEPTPTAAPAPAPAAPAELEPEVPQELSPEELAKKESEFVKTTAAQIDAPMTEEDIDVILAGGKEAISKLQDIRRRDMATSIMLTRKAIAQGLNPVMNEIFAGLKPLIESHQQLQRYTVEQQFVAQYKDFVPHVETARSIAEELLKCYPTEVAKLSREQFLAEVARQTDLNLTREHKRWFPEGNGNWRTSATPPAPAAPAVIAATPTIPAAPAAPAPPPVRPPAANLPSGISATGTPDWKKSVAQSMR